LFPAAVFYAVAKNRLSAAGQPYGAPRDHLTELRGPLCGGEEKGEGREGKKGKEWKGRYRVIPPTKTLASGYGPEFDRFDIRISNSDHEGLQAERSTTARRHISSHHHKMVVSDSAAVLRPTVLQRCCASSTAYSDDPLTAPSPADAAAGDSDDSSGRLSCLPAGTAGRTSPVLRRRPLPVAPVPGVSRAQRRDAQPAHD